MKSSCHGLLLLLVAIFNCLENNPCSSHETAATQIGGGYSTRLGPDGNATENVTARPSMEIIPGTGTAAGGGGGGPVTKPPTTLRSTIQTPSTSTSIKRREQMTTGTAKISTFAKKESESSNKEMESRITTTTTASTTTATTARTKKSTTSELIEATPVYEGDRATDTWSQKSATDTMNSAATSTTGRTTRGSYYKRCRRRRRMVRAQTCPDISPFHECGRWKETGLCNQSQKVRALCPWTCHTCYHGN